jgi:CBS-domain-containing membrane protein
MASGADRRVRRAAARSLALLPSPPGAQVEEAPFCIAASASMGQVHFYFSMLSLSCAFVTDHGKYVGMITQADLMAANL